VYLNARRVSREIQTGDLEHLGRLPGTRVEGERIASLLGVKPLLGRFDQRSDSQMGYGRPLKSEAFPANIVRIATR
jgi:hypothetical protein